MVCSFHLSYALQVQVLLFLEFLSFAYGSDLKINSKPSSPFER